MLNDKALYGYLHNSADIYCMNWMPHPLTLEGEYVKLVPFEEKYVDELYAISTDERIWEFLPAKGMDRDEYIIAMKSAILKRMNGEEYPFVIIDKIKNCIIGSTRYIDIQPEYKKLEIGWTWYTPSYWGSGHNLECKYLLLQYAFEQLGCVRVQLKTRDTNMRSRAAVEKIGATFEGMLRNFIIRFEHVRDVTMYSIIDTEWANVKAELQQKVNNRLKNGIKT